MMTGQNLIVTTSWDDGTKTDIRLAGLLKKYGLAGTFYIPRFMENALPPPDVVALGREFEIGAHSLTQPDLTRIPPAGAGKEIGDSKSYLEELLGYAVPMFCYPYGTYNRPVMDIVRRCGFVAARTAEVGGLAPPGDPYAWHITLAASNASPLMALKICRAFRLWSPAALLDWESRAKAVFDIALRRGGVYHIYGHSEECERRNMWEKLERVFAHISGRVGVRYLTNGEIFGGGGR